MTIYECILDTTTHYAQTEKEAMDWLDSNPTGKYRNALHKFEVKGKGAKIVTRAEIEKSAPVVHR